MKAKFYVLLFLVFFAVSCKDDNNALKIDQEKGSKKQEDVFRSINRGWVFEVPPLDAKTQEKLNDWLEWRNFLTEINQKPKSSISAFQKKAVVLSKKVADLVNNIPPEFNKPQVKARIAVLTTKVRQLDLYIHLNPIPSKKVLKLVDLTNRETNYLQLEMQQIITKKNIPIEDGEEMYHMKDTARALPNVPTELQ